MFPQHLNFIFLLYHELKEYSAFPAFLRVILKLYYRNSWMVFSSTAFEPLGGSFSIFFGIFSKIGVGKSQHSDILYCLIFFIEQ